MFNIFFSIRSKVISLVYCKKSHQLISGGEDAIVVFWDMKANRQEVRKEASLN